MSYIGFALSLTLTTFFDKCIGTIQHWDLNLNVYKKNSFSFINVQNMSFFVSKNVCPCRLKM